MAVPLFDLQQQHQALAPELKTAFHRVLNSGQFILGREVEALETTAANYLKTKHAIGVSSGTDALLLGLMTLEIGPGDEVLCPNFTFFATAGSIARLGAKPVFVDVCPICFNIDVAAAAKKITPRTKAILPVHLFGQAAEMDAVIALAKDHNLKVVEDVAQAMGAHYRGRPLGTIGDFGAFSFFPTKNLGGFGDAGLLTCQDPELARKARQLRVHGMTSQYCHQYLGGNFRLDALQAALLHTKFSRIEDYISQRQANATYYNQCLSALPGVQPADASNCSCDFPQSNKKSIQNSPQILLPVAYEHNRHTWNQYTLRVLIDGGRDALKAHLANRGIGSAIYYPETLDRQPCFESYCDADTEKSLKTNSHLIAQQCLSIPIYPELTRQQQDEVIAGIETFLQGA